MMNANDRQLPDEVHRSVAREIVKSVDRLVLEAIAATRPIEVDPYRSRLFELFVTADGAGLVRDDRETPVDFDEDDTDETDLSSDSLCRLLAGRWGLDLAARESAATQKRLPQDQLDRMRALWSVMRMWMEWTYAWKRWSEFHRPAEGDESSLSEDASE